MSKTRIPRLRILLPYVKDSYSMTQEPAPMSKAHNPCSNSGTALPTTTPLRSSALNNCRPTSLAFFSTDSSPQALYSGDEHPVALAKSAKNRPLNRFANITVCEYILKPLCQSGVWCVCVLHLPLASIWSHALEYGSTPYVGMAREEKWLPRATCTKSYVQNSALDIVILGLYEPY